MTKMKMAGKGYKKKDETFQNSFLYQAMLK